MLIGMYSKLDNLPASHINDDKPKIGSTKAGGVHAHELVGYSALEQ